MGDYLRYASDGHNGMMDMVYINKNDTDRNKDRIELLRGNTMIVTKYFLKSRNMPDMG